MPTSDSLERAQEILGHRFRDLDILREALTHASIADTRASSNERMEFLGDAILGLVVCEHLFRAYPNLLEGDMTKIKSVAVSRRTCARIAGELDLVGLLKLGKGMQTNGGLPASLAAAALESVIAALYLDGGFEAVERFLRPFIEPVVARAARSGHQQNFKSVLQHIAQDLNGAIPNYLLLDEKGPDHAKCFEVGVQIAAQTFESSWGPSKKQAEQQAALNALFELGYALRDESGNVVVATPPSLVDDEAVDDEPIDEDEALDEALAD